MVVNSDKPLLVAISVRSIQREPYIVNGRVAQSADIKGESSDPNSRFSIRTGLLNDEQLRRCELLKRHGSTMVELPDGYRGDNRWIDTAIQKAMDRIAGLYEGKEGTEQMEKYNPDFALEVLTKVNENFPTPVEPHDLKHLFANEPSDAQLLIALDGLQCEGFIEGMPIYEHTTGQRKLAMMANITMTAKGRQHLSPVQSHSGVGAPTIIQGDQFNNFGQAGAIGPHSTGTIHYQQQWTTIQNQVDLNALACELDELRKHLHQSASSSSDYQQLALLSVAEEQAKKHDGSKAMEILSKVGKGALGVAKEIGTGIAAKMIAKSMGLEP